MEYMKIEELEVYLKEEIAKCTEKGAKLSADDRKDEAVFAVVRSNVLDIFKTVLSVAKELSGGEEEKCIEFFRNKLDQIPEKWNGSLQQARMESDIKTAHVERIKLEAVRDIQQKIEELWEPQA